MVYFLFYVMFILEHYKIRIFKLYVEISQQQQKILYRLHRNKT